MHQQPVLVGTAAVRTDGESQSAPKKHLPISASSADKLYNERSAKQGDDLSTCDSLRNRCPLGFLPNPVSSCCVCK